MNSRRAAKDSKLWSSITIVSKSRSGSAITAVVAGLEETSVALGADDVSHERKAREIGIWTGDI
jgi:hypothetical protein